MLEPASANGSGEARRSDDDRGSHDEPAPGVDGTAPAGREILPVQRLGAALEVLLCSGFPTQILLIAVLTGFGMRMHEEPGRLSPLFVFTVSLLDTALVLALISFFVRAHRESPHEIFVGRRRVGREAVLGLVLVPVLFMIVFAILALVMAFAPRLHNVERNPFEDLMQTPRDVLAFGVVVMVAGGLREEVQRAFVLRRFEQYLGGGAVGVVVFSAAFGLGHVEQGLDAALATAVLGASWGVIYLIRRSIVAPMVSHAAFNLAQLLKYVSLA